MGARRFVVYSGPDAVLEVEDEPGPLSSTAPLPRGQRPIQHPFLTATALDGGEEHRIRGLLEGAADLEAFLGRLRAAGYHVEERRG